MIKKAIHSRHFPLFVSTILGLLFLLISYDYGMFWDNVLFASKMGNHLFENGLFHWTIPDDFDPGHPPFLAFLLAIIWKILGHSLWSSHVLMYPFICGVIYQLYRFTYYYVRNKRLAYFGVLLLLTDPTLMTSFVLVNPETLIIFFFFLAINGMLYKKNHWKFIGLLFLSFISFRSMMIFAGLFLFDILNQSFIHRKKIKESINYDVLKSYFFASIPGISYVIWRLVTKGWLQTHSESPWASLWQFATIKDFFHNVLVLIWRYADFGRIYIFLFLIFAFWFLIKKLRHNESIKQLLLLAISSVGFVIITVLLSTNSFGHRYFIISYICFTLIAFLILLEFKKYKRAFFIFLWLGLFSGNLWIYPEKISQGWDATLAHTPYHQLRKEAIKFLDDQEIDFKQVGTFFPNYNTIDEIDFTNDQRSFARFNEKNNYVFYSNVYNLSDNDHSNLEKKYTEIKRFQRFGIYVSVLKKDLIND